ncbi:MAG: terminase large subunit [Azospirillum sp.]|nr:terminase large subunit [Azospirillum sp.]
MIFSPDPERYPDPSGRAERICRFLEHLRLWEGDFAGKRFRLHPFQRAVIRRIYGPRTPDGRRLVRLVLIWIPRGNAKTTLAAGLGLAHFLGPEAEPGGQVVLAAADQANAGIAFKHAWEMTKAEPRLMSRVRPLESRMKLLHPGTSGELKAISSEAYSKHGLNVSFFLADEIHAWPPPEDRKLYKTVTDSMVKRTQPLTVVISTAGAGQGGLAWDLWDYAHKVASGAIDDPSVAPIIFAADNTADWRDQDQWHLANPAIAAGFCSLEELTIKARRIVHFPAEIADFKRFHLNIWQEGTAEPWVDLGLYDQAAPATSAESLIGRRCWVGVDLSSVEDLTAVVAVFPEGSAEDPALDVLAQFFLPEARIAEKADKDRADYLKWAADGYLTLTPGNRVDYDVIVAHLVGVAERHEVVEIAIDRWNSTAVTTRLQAFGLPVVEFGQGYASMSAPVKALKRAILGHQFRHGGNPVLRLCFANAVAERDGPENEKFTKAKARGRIDGAVASAMAVGRMIAADRTDLNDLILRRGGLA